MSPMNQIILIKLVLTNHGVRVTMPGWPPNLCKVHINNGSDDSPLPSAVNKHPTNKRFQLGQPNRRFKWQSLTP